jgi:hypothetical protein
VLLIDGPPVEPYATCHVAPVVPVTTEHGRAVGKIPCHPRWNLGPARRCRDAELVTRDTWNGQGALWRLNHDTATNALLIEECRPG